MSQLMTLVIQVDGGENPMQFSQVFHLIPEGGSYYVYVHPTTIVLLRLTRRGLRFNDIFRLNYG